MAFGCILRRASASALPFARSVASRSAFHSALCPVICVEKQSVVLHQVAGCQLFLPFSRFSTARPSKPSADTSLIRVLDSEIDCAEDPKHVSAIIPQGFPFKIQDKPGERTILLERSYQDEIIKVEVDAVSFGDDAEEDEDDDQDGNAEDSSVPPSIPLVVSISKDVGQCLEFGITAFPDEISIDTVSIKDLNPNTPEDQLAYEGPDFSDLDENLQKAFQKYLEIRGIKPSTTNVLFDYMKNKDDIEYVRWLENLKSFVEN